MWILCIWIYFQSHGSKDTYVNLYMHVFVHTDAPEPMLQFHLRTPPDLYPFKTHTRTHPHLSCLSPDQHQYRTVLSATQTPYRVSPSKQSVGSDPTRVSYSTSQPTSPKVSSAAIPNTFDLCKSSVGSWERKGEIKIKTENRDRDHISPYKVPRS